MPANTPKGYPYPLGTDRVQDGDDAIHNLALALDSRLAGGVASGFVTLPAPSALNTASNLAITFPVGLFTAAPNIITSLQVGAPWNVLVSVNTAPAPTAAGCSLVGGRIGGPLNNIPTYWAAHQP